MIASTATATSQGTKDLTCTEDMGIKTKEISGRKASQSNRLNRDNHNKDRPIKAN